MNLYPHQQDLVDRVRGAFARHRSVLMQGATGIGKTAVASHIIRLSVAHDRRVLFLAHLDSLITDTSARLMAAGVAHGIVQADRPQNAAAPVQVASLQTLHARPDCRPAADLIIVDECRRAAAPTVRAILESYPKAYMLGLDATPQRGDGSSLGDLFDAMVSGPSIAWLTERGYLVPCVVLSPPSPTEGALAMDPVEAAARHAAHRRAIVFCADVAHATDVAARFGPRARLVTGATPRADREAIRADVAAGLVHAVVNVDVYRDGADLPSLDCVILARPMSVVSAFLQAVGRGMRAHPGKADCLVLDLSGAAIMWGLPADERTWSLDGPPSRVGAALLPLSRCAKCFAVFHSGPAECPRCGDQLTRRNKVKRRVSRIERQELARLDTTPQHIRDQIALAGIEKRLRASGRFSEAQIPHIARAIFRKKMRKEAIA